jgi:glycosyltransferase involved in cell wall biosynthesis
VIVDSDRSRRLCVVTLIDSLAGAGGGELMARTIATHLGRSRIRSVLWATRPSQPGRAEEIAAQGIETFELDRGSRLDLSAWIPLISFLRRERVDILHCHKFGSNVWGTLAGRLAGVPVVIAHEHTWSYEGRPLRRFLDRELIARAADVFLAVSREDRRRMIEVEHIEPGRIRVTPMAPLAFTLPRSPTHTRRIRAELDIRADDPVVGTVSVLRRQKALDVLVRAALPLLSDFPRLKVLIAGGGPEEARLRALIGELGLKDTVILLGSWRAEEVPDFLSAIDVAVNCSNFEGTPAAIVEAMAAGRPVVATRVGGTPDLIEHDVHGLLVKPQDVPGLAEAIRELLADPDRRARLGEAARARQRREFDVSVLVRRLEDLYEYLWATSDRGRLERSRL